MKVFKLCHLLNCLAKFYYTGNITGTQTGDPGFSWPFGFNHKASSTFNSPCRARASTLQVQILLVNALTYPCQPLQDTGNRWEMKGGGVQCVYSHLKRTFALEVWGCLKREKVEQV